MENGSFLSEDNYLGTKDEPLTRNRYAYVSNNPVNYVDPSGHMGLSRQTFKKHDFLNTGTTQIGNEIQGMISSED